MKDADMKARLKELYLPPATEFVLVDVPEMRYLMVDGRGAADRTALDHAVKWLFTVIHPIKRVARERMGKNFVEPPLEGLWWADDVQDFICGNRDKLKWRMMIVYEPDWLTEEMFEDGVAAAKTRLGEPPDGLRIESYHEGLSAQIMHVGPPSEEGPTVARLHQEFLPANGLLPHGHHHEIYLTDPNRTEPEKMRTVLRQPVRRSG
ncbi:MAG: GyrI-like domain-containing protein [Planctomycetes bacterium]|nr:GyrI-like domain-containing protein [Planctomycetota bacterium]